MMKKRIKQTRSIISKFKGIFSRSSGEEMIGEVLVSERIITRGELDAAIEVQKETLFAQGKAVPLGQIIVEHGGTSESEIVRAVNAHYNISITSLSDNIKGLVKKIGGSLAEDFPAPRIPFWLQLLIATMLMLTISMGVFGYVVMERQKDKLYDQTVKLGTVSLNYFGNNAKIPLLTDDILALNTLINNATSVEGQLYAFIVDNRQLTKAHTDHEQIDKVFEPFENVDNAFQKGFVTYFDYTLPDNSHVLNLSMPIIFKEKKLGDVHVGLSIDFIQRLFSEELKFLAGSVLVITFLGIVVAVVFSRRFSRPVSTLVHATSEIARGHYEFKVDLDRNDEFGTLGEAFNRMAVELYRQSLMKETFGKYVGPEVVDMIMRSPGNDWLKGRKNEASILFADIRGFTAYSESKEPEEVVEKLNELFEIATDVILRHGGYIDKFIGDSVLGVFGVPVYHKDHAKRCILAAVDMQKELAKAAKSGNALLSSVGIGITSGVVVAGNIGSQAKMEYTVIGDSVNVASYLNGLAGAGEIIVGGNEVLNLEHVVDVEALEPQKIKGRGELVKVYRVVGVKNIAE